MMKSFFEHLKTTLGKDVNNDDDTITDFVKSIEKNGNGASCHRSNISVNTVSVVRYLYVYVSYVYLICVHVCLVVKKVP